MTPREPIISIDEIKGPPHDLRPAFAEAITDRHYLLIERNAAQAEVARLTRERDAALEALRTIEAPSAASDRWTALDYCQRIAHQTITSIESGAIHNA